MIPFPAVFEIPPLAKFKVLFSIARTSFSFTCFKCYWYYLNHVYILL